MSVDGSAKKRVRVSKNRKKSWNKYCDVKEVEDFLEEKRFEERIGGAPSEKADEELFFVETQASKTAEGKNRKKPWKCHQNIGSYSKVLPPRIICNEQYSKKIKTSLLRADKRRSKRLKAQAVKEKSKSKSYSQTGDFFSDVLKDLWDENKPEVDADIKDLITFRDEITRKRRPNVPNHRYQKPSLLPPVEVPHAGSSYNPSYGDHQDLLLEAVKEEEKKEAEELHLKRVLTDMFPSKANAPTADSILKEMSQGLFDDAEENDDKEPVCLYLTRNPAVSADDRLPKSRHRRRKEMKEQARLRALEKLQKKRISEIYRLRSIKSELKKGEELTKIRVGKKFDREIEKMYKPRTLSKHKYEAPDLEVNLTEELSGSFRTLKTEGNLLEDRYKSFQRRNLIETRVIQKRKRKYKLKVQVKRNHRNFK